MTGNSWGYEFAARKSRESRCGQSIFSPPWPSFSQAWLGSGERSRCLVRMSRRARPCAISALRASPVVRASRSSNSGFFEPLMRVRLIVAGLDFKISALAIQRVRFFEGPIGLEAERAHARFSCARFQHFEDAPSDAETARIGGDPHALDFADTSIFHFERAATDGLTAEAGDDGDAGGGGQVIGGRRGALWRVGCGVEAEGPRGQTCVG